MTVRIITDSNGRKHITNEPLLHQPAPVQEDWGPGPHEVHSLPAPVDWKTEYLKSVESGCSTLDELREARAELDALKQALAAQPAPVAQCTNSDTWNCKYCHKTKTCAALEDPRNFAAQPAAPTVQEPVACQVCGGSGFIECDALQSREKNNGKWGRCLNCQPYTPPAAQPAIPDAFGTREGEHPQYIQGWNDCRAEMLKGMK
jgi:hypothetical protein